MANKLNITRRDFLGGVALSLAAGTSLSPLEILAMEGKSPYYPPSLTGLRGSHAGSFEIAHAVAWSDAKFDRPENQTDKTYDLVVVGGGISGLAAAHFYRQRAGTDKSILVLDNHDDFGGHAKRNEFDVDGEKLICYGGSQSIDTPSSYSPVSAQMLMDVGIDTEAFYEYFDQSYFERRGSRPAIYFSKERYGRDATLPNVLGDYRGGVDEAGWESLLARYPISDESKRIVLELISNPRDYLSGIDNEEKIALLRGMPFSDFLRNHVGATDEVVSLMRDQIKGYWGVGWDALSALEAYRLEQPGTGGLDLGDNKNDKFNGVNDPYIFHFPDGNASVARSLVRKLIPESVPGNTMEDLVTSVVDYSLLDRDKNACRIRLNSTAVDVRHAADESHVDITYMRNGKPERVKAKHVVLACYNAMIPHICPEVPESQVSAIAHATKIPLVYLSIAVRNWQAWDNLGTHSIYQPQSPYMHSFGLDFPVSMGDYRFTQSPDTPTVLHGSFVPTEPDKGLTDKEQNISGRQRIYEMSYDDHEQLLLAQMDGALSAGGFDAERDIAAITINRWPHGYAYEYNDLFDSPDYNPYNGPHIAGRAQIGRISIANSDASAYAYVNAAIDAADRAVNEQIKSN